jgi:putative SOS response-associated peptidase YedK
MCGRFTLTMADAEEIARILGLTPDPQFVAHYRPRFNVAPTDEHWIVRTGRSVGSSDPAHRELVPAQWGGKPSKDRAEARRQKGAPILTRVENARARKMLDDPNAGHRCLVAADGFFEWTGEKGDRRPVWFHRSNEGELVLLGAVCTEWKDGFHFSILTTAANDLVAPVHDRMPVVVPTKDATKFLTTTDPRELASMLRPAPEGALVAREVSHRVNVVGNDDPECLAPPDRSSKASKEPASKKGQMRLF